MFMFVLKTDGWHCQRVDSIESAAIDAELNIELGYTVAFENDIDYFAEQLKLKLTCINLEKLQIG